MRASLLLGTCLSVLFTVLPATSQNSQNGSIRTHIEGIEIPTIPNAPFTARVIVTWDQPPVGGGTVSRKYYTMVARDSQGRVHRESRGFVPANSNDEPPLRDVFLLDPVSGTRTACSSASMTCSVGAYHPRLLLAGGAADQSANSAAHQSLGTETIENLPVVGTREMEKNMAGTNGNRRLALTYTDSWYSPDLQMNISVVRKNPEMGQVTLSVTDLVRGEPDKSWFAVPSGFEVKNGPTR